MSPQVQEQLAALVRPRPAEVLQAKTVMISILGTGSRTTASALIEAAITDAGSELHPRRGQFVQLWDIERDPAARLDPDEPLIRMQRLRLAAEEALAELELDEVVQPMKSPASPGDVMIPAGAMSGGGGWSGAAHLTADRPALAEAYRLTRRMINAPELGPLVAGLDPAGFADLLGPRGQRCFREALRAFERGLYLSAANMLAAASEAAWYALARAARDGGDARLEKPLDEDNTVKVIALVAERLKSVPRSRSAVDELVTQAAHLRDLRNYAVHPRPDSDRHLEAQLSEIGMLALLTTGHRYLIRLSDIGQAANLTPIEADAEV